MAGELLKMNGYLPLDVAYEEPSADSVIRNRMDTWNERGLKGYLHATEPYERRRRIGLAAVAGTFYLFLAGAGVIGCASNKYQGAAALPFALSALAAGGVGLYVHRPNEVIKRREIAQEILEGRIKEE